MQRYPTSEGLAVPIQELGYEVMPDEVLRTQGHHFYFEREWYNSRVRQVFRNLLGHVVRMKPVEHQDLHDRFGPPLMPRDYEMIEVIDEFASLNGLVICHKERKLRETYQIQIPQWEEIKLRS